MRRARRLLDVAVFAPLGAVATFAAAARRRRHPELTTPPEAPVVAAATVAPDPPAEPAGDVEDLPIDGYDHLAASQVVDRLAALTPPELALVAAYEQTHRHRQSVLAMIAQLQG